MNNVILKTALKTLLALLIALILAFGIASLGFPGHMATLFENMRAYNFAAGYAGLAYSYSGTIQNLARCLDDSILAGDNVNVINYGGQLVKSDGFAEYAAARTEEERAGLPDELKDSYDYYNTVYGNVACAQYYVGDKTGALATANGSMQNLSGFPKNNALAALAIHTVGDKPFMQELYDAIKRIEPAEKQKNYYDAVIAMLTKELGI